jgi:hypothetical protein
VKQDVSDNLDAARAAVGAACAQAEGLLATALALRQASDDLRRQFERQGVGWQGSPECYSYDKAIQPLAERLYDSYGQLFRLCNTYRCTVFDARAHRTRAVNAIGEQALRTRQAIAAAGFCIEPSPWEDGGHAVAAADAETGLPPELAELPSLRWAQEQRVGAWALGGKARYLTAAGFVLLGAAGASASGMLAPIEGGVGFVFLLAMAASGGWAAGSLFSSLWRRLRHHRLMSRPSMRILAEFRRS